MATPEATLQRSPSARSRQSRRLFIDPARPRRSRTSPGIHSAAAGADAAARPAHAADRRTAGAGAERNSRPPRRDAAGGASRKAAAVAVAAAGRSRPRPPRGRRGGRIPVDPRAAAPIAPPSAERLPGRPMPRPEARPDMRQDVRQDMRQETRQDRRYRNTPSVRRRRAWTSTAGSRLLCITTARRISLIFRRSSAGRRTKPR